MGNVVVRTTWGNLNPPKVSAWDAAKADYDARNGVGAFDALPRVDSNGQNQQTAALRAYMAR